MEVALDEVAVFACGDHTLPLDAVTAGPPRDLARHVPVLPQGHIRLARVCALLPKHVAHIVI